MVLPYSGVESIQEDLSGIVQSNAATVVGQVVASRRGKITPTLSTNSQQILDRYGNDPKYGLSIETALHYSSTIGQMILTRAVSGAWAKAGQVLFWDDTLPEGQKLQLQKIEQSTTNTPPDPFNSVGYSQAEDTDYAAALAFKAAYDTANTSDIELLLAIRAIGPGVYANEEIWTQIVSTNLMEVDNQGDDAYKDLASVNGGSLTAGTYDYLVTATNQNGELGGGTLNAAKTHTVTITGPNVTAGERSAKIRWTQQEQATGFRIYKWNTGASEWRFLAETSRNYYIDNGTITPDANDLAPATATTKYTNDNRLILRVFDSVVSRSVPRETFTITFFDSLDGFGNNSKVEYQINEDTTNYIVVNNLIEESSFNTSDDLPKFNSSVTSGGVPTQVVMSGGADGDTIPDSAAIANTWSTYYTDRDQLRITVAVDGGFANGTVASAMYEVTQKQRCHAILDVPLNKITATGAINYRRSLPGVCSDRRLSIYAPYMLIKSQFSGKEINLPGSAYAAYCFGFTDAVATAGRSPAGLNRGRTRALDAANRSKALRYTDGERAQMVQAQVNYFRFRPQAGWVLWEERTLQPKFTAASFIAVSRIWDVIQNSMLDFLEYELQEPNDDFFALQIKQALEEYLETQVQARNINRYKVYVDEKAGNTPDVLGAGRRNIDVYIEPTLPADQIRLRSILTRQGADFEFLAGAA